MAITRLSLSSILNSPKYDSILANQQSLPSVPTIGTATDGGTGTTVNVAFTAGGIAGSSYTALSTPGSITATGTSSPITVSGLTAGTAYTFQVRATNNVGNSAYSAASNSVTPAVPAYVLAVTANTTQNYTVPAGVNLLAFAGAGAGGGGGATGNPTAGARGAQSAATFIYTDRSVTPGDVIGITIGAGGLNNGNAGGITQIKLNTNTTLLTVNGGGAGGSNTLSNVTTNLTQHALVASALGGSAGTSNVAGGVGGAGGTAVSNIAGVSSFAGGGAGGGGGGAGFPANGQNNFSAPGAGGSPYGGSGGTTNASYQPGGPGGNANGPGGGGGGAGGNGDEGQTTLGGSGGSARILIYKK